MTIENEYDHIQRFIFKDRNIRGEIIRLKKTYEAISERYVYPIGIQRLLGEALTAVGMLHAILKSVDSIILQVQTRGPMPLLVAQCKAPYHLRGLAKWEEALTENTNKFLNNGHLALTITSVNQERYQGIVELNGGTLASALETYFAQSEQLPTQILLFADENVVAGMLLQTLPNAETETNSWDHIRHLASTLTPNELFTLPNEMILKRLFHEETIQLFDSEPVQFHCSCNVERMQNAIRMLEKNEIDDLLKHYKKITVTCEFCNHQHDFDAHDVQKILAESSELLMGDSSTSH